MRSRRPGAPRHLAALGLAGALALAGCSDDGGSSDAGPTGGDGTTATDGTEGGGDGGGQTGSPEAVAPPTAPADIQAAPGDRSASGGGGSVTVDADQAAFVLPSGNIACSVTAAGAVCQIEEKSFTPSPDHLSDANLAGCSAEAADAMRLAEGRGAWTCVPEPLAGQADVTTGGWWAEQVDAETTEEDGATLAVLPYGWTLTVGGTSCTSAESGVSCVSNDLGRSFTLASSTYNYG